MYSFVIPAFNEEQNIENLYNRLKGLIEKDSAVFEMIFVDDGSRDQTVERIKELIAADKRVKLISLSRNFGHQAALTAGLHHASGDAIISLDCDLQDPPEIILQMIEKWKAGADIVYARRLNFRKDNWLKKLGSRFYYKILDKIADIKIPPNVGDFRLVSKAVLDELNQMGEKSRYLRGMVAWTGFKNDFVDYYRPDRESGESGYSFKKLILLGMNGFLDFSFLPLRLGFILGLISIFVGFGLMAYQLYDAIVNKAYYHLYKWLSVATFIFMGFMFMLIWIIGEYIGKIYNEVRSRPIYIVKEKLNFQGIKEKNKHNFTQNTDYH
jgi:dolichol-phosphate mannosyltransferase